MKYGICNLSIIPIRKEPSDKSEMVSQILFGEVYEIIEQTNKWLRIKLLFDAYEGWIDVIQTHNISESYFIDFKNYKHDYLNKFSTIVFKDNIFYPILMGSTLPFYKEGEIRVGENTLKIDGKNPEAKGIRETAFQYYNAPYLWGGKTVYGIDCSGFTQQVFKLNSINILRDAYQQAEQGTSVDIENSKEGDLAFFKNNDGRVIHVGIVLNNNKIIHSHGRVRVDNLDEKGIYNTENQLYTHQFHSIKKFS